MRLSRFPGPALRKIPTTTFAQSKGAHSSTKNQCEFDVADDRPIPCHQVPGEHFDLRFDLIGEHTRLQCGDAITPRHLVKREGKARRAKSVCALHRCQPVFFGNSWAMPVFHSLQHRACGCHDKRRQGNFWRRDPQEALVADALQHCTLSGRGRTAHGWNWDVLYCLCGQDP